MDQLTDDIVQEFAKNHFHYAGAKVEQLNVIRKLAAGISVCAVLPTGYGKSFIYFAVALALHRASISKTVVVVTPLVSLAQDQFRRAQKIGIRCMILKSLRQMDSAEIQNVVNGCFQLSIRVASSVCLTLHLVFTSPECFVEVHEQRTCEPWYKRLKKVELLVIDEVHTVVEWCDTVPLVVVLLTSRRVCFRPSLTDLGAVTLHLNRHAKVPLLLLTATLINTTFQQLSEVYPNHIPDLMLFRF